MAKNVAFLFPGQGSQYTGMGLAFHDAYPEARQIFESADEALEFDITGLCFNGPETSLKKTAITQPAILTVSVAIDRVLAGYGFRPDFVMGHSLGEYSALVASGAVDFQDAVRVVHLRGRFMQEAVEEGRGAMAAILGLQADIVEKICREAEKQGVVSPANFNTREQTVIAGEKIAVEEAASRAEAAGASKVVFLPVSAPFHCALMAPARDKLALEIEKIPFSDLSCPLITNVDAAPITSGAQAKDALIRQVCNPVRWVDSMACLLEMGVQKVLEVGPGKVLTGLSRKISRDIKIFNSSDEKHLTKFLENGNK